MPNRKLAAALRLTVLCVALLVGGCSFQPPSATAPVRALPPLDVRGHIVVWGWNIAAKSLMAIVPAFNRRDPHVQVEVDMTGARMKTRFMLALAAGVGSPDVSELSGFDAPHYIATERLADLTAVAAKYKRDFPASVWNDCLMNGHVYAIPWDTGPCAIYYKRDLFAKYGIDPNDIDTWDDYIRAGVQILQKSNGRTKMLPLGSNDLEPIFELLIQQTGGQVFDDRGRVAINTPACWRALDILRRMRQSGICSDIPMYSQEWMAGLSDSSIATYPGAVWLAGTIKDTVGVYSTQKANWGVFRLPAIEPGGLHSADAGGSVLVIPAQCQDKDAAWAFVQYALCTKEGQIQHYKNFSIFPAFLPALDTAAVQAPDPFFGGQRVGILFATDLTRIPVLNRTAHWSEAAGYLTQDLSHWAATGLPGDAGFFNRMETKLHSRLRAPISPMSLTLAQGAPP